MQVPATQRLHQQRSLTLYERSACFNSTFIRSQTVENAARRSSTQSPSSSVEIYFNPCIPELAWWSNHTRLPFPMSVQELRDSYALAQPYLVTFSRALAKTYGWIPTRPRDPRMLFSMSGPSPFKHYPPVVISIPKDATSFFSPNRTTHFQMVFHSSGFQALRHTTPPIANLFHLLMCLIPGLLTVVHRETMEKYSLETTRVLPPAEWMMRHRGMLQDVFGEEGTALLLSTANNVSRAFRSISRPADNWRAHQF